MIFLIGTLWFWLLVTLAVILIFVSIESDKPNLRPNLIVITTIALIYFLGSGDALRNLFSNVISNPSMIIVFVIAYTLVGLLWSFFKWYTFLLDWKSRNKGRTFEKYDLPSPTKHKSMLVSSMIYWPFSVIWYAINKPVRRFFNWIYNEFVGVYDRIQKSVLKDVHTRDEMEKKYKI